jgi:hypothetical protein
MVVVFSAPADYLATHGSVPIQFQVVPKPAVAPATLLAKALSASTDSAELHPPQVIETASEHVVAAEPSHSSGESVVSKSPEPYFSTAALLFPSTPPEAASEALTPQMLLQFFQSTGGDRKKGETTVTGTVSFAPPRPDSKPASRATLITP